MATGIRLAPEEIKGLAAAPEANATLYDRAGVALLTKRIAAFAGGTVVISVPAGALKCPPAPYELALLMAERMKANKLKGRIVLIDAWPTPQPSPLGDALLQALSAHGDLIDYLGQAEVQAVDTGARKVATTLGEEFAYDLLSLIPPNRASRLVLDLDLADKGDVFVAVDPVTLRSAADPNLFAAGDVARTPFGKSAAAAADMGHNCAHAIARMIGVKGLAEPTAGEPARVNTVCYPYVDSGHALGLEVVHTVSGAETALKYNSRIVSNRGRAAANVAQRHAWEAALVKSALGG
jgi:NADPH-dependent 2,4-dienoyl-CoA reductase/sulfur reductase-like enzyme